MSGSPSERIRDSAVATGKGDDGTTGMLFGGPRIAKDDPRTEAYGTIDEAVAALGVARAELLVLAQANRLAALGPIVLRLQRELFVVAAELATGPDAWGRLRDGETRVDAGMVEGLEDLLGEAEAGIEMPREFIVPGETRVSAALELARTIIRRAERRAVTLHAAGSVAGDHLLPYLNRLADLVWVLARVAEQAESHAPVPARTRRVRDR
jgi:cob(I)alamin adenosyltransferase